MLSIVMDSANQYLVVGLYEDGCCLEKIQEMGNRKQSEYAVVYLEKLLNNHGKTMKDVSEIIITIGPGSYTGVRVALTIAKTLNASLNIPVKAISSLQAFAGEQSAISILDARSHKAFLGIYDQGQAIKEECLVDLEDIEDYQKMYPDFKVVGDASLIGQETEDVDLADNIYNLALKQDYVQEVDGLVPMYMKEVEAKKICK